MSATQIALDTAYDCYGHSSLVTGLLFSDSGLWLASGSSDARVKIWIDGVEWWSFEEHTNGISTLACSPDSTLLASASLDGAVKLWDMTKGTLLCAMDGHDAQVASVAFSASGQHLASSYSNGMLEGHTESVGGIAFSPRNSHFVSWSDTMAVLWDLSTHAQTAILRLHSRPVTFLELTILSA